MNNLLTHEQSQRLIELGVDLKLASRFNIECQLDDSVIKFPLFSLSDILSLLPKEITDHIGTYRLRMEFGERGWSAYYVDYGINGDDDEPYADGIFIATELIDALYELLVWCITNKHLKL